MAEEMQRGVPRGAITKFLEEETVRPYKPPYWRTDARLEKYGITNESRLGKLLERASPYEPEPSTAEAILRVPGQALKGFVNEAAFGLPELALEATERKDVLEYLEPRNLPERIAEQVGELGGFIAGGPMKLASKIAGRLAKKAIAQGGERLFAKKLIDTAGKLTARGKALQESVTLGIASALTGNEALGQYIADPKFERLMDFATDKVINTALGTVTGARFELLKAKVDNFAVRAAMNLAISNATSLALSGGQPNYEGLIFNSLLDIWFSKSGKKPSKAEEAQIADLAKSTAPAVEKAQQQILPVERRLPAPGETTQRGFSFRPGEYDVTKAPELIGRRPSDPFPQLEAGAARLGLPAPGETVQRGFEREPGRLVTEADRRAIREAERRGLYSGELPFRPAGQLPAPGEAVQRGFERQPGRLVTEAERQAIRKLEQRRLPSGEWITAESKEPTAKEFEKIFPEEADGGAKFEREQRKFEEVFPELRTPLAQIEPRRIKVDKARVDKFRKQGMSEPEAKQAAVNEMITSQESVLPAKKQAEIAEAEVLPKDYGNANKMFSKADFNTAVADLRKRGICT